MFKKKKAAMGKRSGIPIPKDMVIKITVPIRP